MSDYITNRVYNIDTILFIQYNFKLLTKHLAKQFCGFIL